MLINGTKVTYTSRTSCRFINCTSLAILNIQTEDLVYCVGGVGNTIYLCTLFQNKIVNTGIVLPLLDNLVTESYGTLYNTSIFKISKTNFSPTIKSNSILSSFLPYYTNYSFDSRNIQTGITGFYEYKDFYYFTFDGGLDYVPTYSRTLNFINQKYVKRVRKDAGIIHDTQNPSTPSKLLDSPQMEQLYFLFMVT